MPTVSLIVTITVLVFLAVFTMVGFHKGLLRILFTTFSVVVVITLSALITQPLAAFLHEKTFVGPEVEKRISEYIEKATAEKGIGVAIGAEDEFVDTLPLPSFVRTDIKENNTLNHYVEMGVNTFAGYISARLTSIVMYAIAFILLFIVLSVLFRVIVFLLKIISKIPVIRGINRLFGGLLGLAEGALILWCICIFIMIFSGTKFGASCMETITGSSVLSFIYNHNIPVIIFGHFFGI